MGYLPFYCENVAVGKVIGNAVPVVRRPRAAVISIDAAFGFAHPAIDLGLPALDAAARTEGIAMLAVRNAYACGSLGYHVERVAARGLVCLGFTNASPMMAGAGGSRPFFGTNPIAIAAPVAGRPPLVIDQSSSVVARVAVADAAARGRVPEGWALDAYGQPTTEPAAALSGSVAPAGGYKGVGLALLVDILAAGIPGANWSYAASSLTDLHGPAPGIGQTFIAVDPAATAAGFPERLATMLAALREDPGVTVPGDRRVAARVASEAAGRISIPAALAAQLRGYAARGAEKDRTEPL